MATSKVKYIDKEDYHNKLILNNTVQLILFLALWIAALYLVLYELNVWWGHIPIKGSKYWFPLIILFSPLIFAIITLTANGQSIFNVSKAVSNIKYIGFFKALFFYDPVPFHFRMREKDKIRNILKEGDIVLRRHDTYVDGVILTQNSYFTHIAIVYEVTDIAATLVHSLGDGGVQWVPLENFIKCDAICVLRFAPKQTENTSKEQSSEKVEFMSEILSSDEFKKENDSLPRQLISPAPKTVWKKKHVKMDEVRDFIHDKSRQLAPDGNPILNDALAKREQDMFELMEKGDHVDMKEFIQLVKDIAKANVDARIQYDFNFDFVDFATMSCIEFVWFCYKSAFPLHRITRKSETYFNFLDCVVLEPDAFLRSKTFQVVFTSLGRGGKKDELNSDIPMDKQKKHALVQYCDNGHSTFAGFFGKFVIAEIIIFVIVALFLHHVHLNLTNHGYMP